MASMSLLSLLLLALQLLACSVHAQDAPLFAEGGLEGATVTNDTLYNTGGTITVQGFTIEVPKNLIVQFPAAWVPWREFVADQEAMMGYEIQVIGNFINGRPIAAQVIAYQFFEGLASGFIESVNFEDGSLKIRNGPTVRISDPNGVFSVGNTVAPFFTADDESPSISSFSGFPMCIPRNTTDPLCPASNRPFQGSGTFAVPDPLSMAPFLAGDFITFSGIRRNNEVIAFSIVAQNVQITTLNKLVYVRMELARIGTSSPNTNTELGESRWIGFTSNANTRLSIYAMDINPCTGAVTDRIISNIGIRNGGNEQNKFEYRADLTSGYVREYRVVAEVNGAPSTTRTKNGFLAGTYVQPVNVWVPAEQLIPGTAPPAYDFSQMGFLTQGVGVDEAGNLWGPLDPFPQTGVLIEDQNCGANLRFAGNDEPTFVPASQLLNETQSANSTNSTTSSLTPRSSKKARLPTKIPKLLKV